MKITIPECANQIIEVLETNGYEAYIVGGCVRDSLMGIDPKDWDITTSASPEQVKGLFSRTIDTGIQHGTVTILIGKEAYEVTTYRLDGKYEDHRRPTSVEFTASLEEDLKRRDFTINAMAYNQKDGIIDLFSGTKDLEQGIIRCVGNPEERFDEDALRILRAVRFSAQLGFDIEGGTQDAIRKKCQFLKNISAERIQVELTKLLCSPNPDRLLTASHLGVTKVVLPEFDAMLVTEQSNPHHIYTVGIHSLKSICYVPDTPIMRWTMLLHDTGKTCTKTTDSDGIDHFIGHAEQSRKIAVGILKRLKLDNHTIKTVERLVMWHDYRWSDEVDRRKVRRAVNRIGPDIFEDLLMVQKADVSAQSSYYQKEKLDLLEQIKLLYQDILRENECLQLKDLAISGKQLIALGVEPGIKMGEILNQLLEVVLESPEKNHIDLLSQIVKEEYLKR